MEFRNSDQLKSHLKTEASRLGTTINNTYNTFFARTLLESIAEYNYGDFVVKGSFSQLVHSGKLYRPVTDIDLSSTNGVKAVDFFHELLGRRGNPVTYEINRRPKITSNGVHNFSVYCCYGSIKHSIGIDFMPDYKPTYEVQYKPVPTIFTKDKKFYINTPSYEEYLAEKLCIVAETTSADSIYRFKDFYDIYKLHGGEYDYDKFSIYFQRMISDRKRINPSDIDVSFLNKDFINKCSHLWESSKRHFKFLDDTVEFDEAVFYTKGVLTDQILKLKRR